MLRELWDAQQVLLCKQRVSMTLGHRKSRSRESKVSQWLVLLAFLHERRDLLRTALIDRNIQPDAMPQGTTAPRPEVSGATLCAQSTQNSCSAFHDMRSGAGKRKWFSQMPYDADDDFINDCMVRFCLKCALPVQAF